MLNQLPGLADDPLPLEVAVRMFDIAHANHCQNDMITVLKNICSITKKSRVSESGWNGLLASGLFPFLVTELSPQSACDMWEPHLLCFKAILRYPPRTQFLQIERVISQDLYIQSVLGYGPWIPDELVCTYVHIVALSVAIYCPDIGAVFDRLTSVYKRVLDDDASICQIRELGSALFPILENHGQSPDLWPALKGCLRGFVESVVAAPFEALTDKAIIAVLEGMRHITAFFPSLCSEFYDLDLCALDDVLRVRRDDYPRLRTCLLESMAELAEYDPVRLSWTDECMERFCGDDGPDVGVHGLGLTAFLFTPGCRPFPDIDDVQVSHWFLDELSTSVVDRAQQLLRTFGIFLTQVQPDINYSEMLPSIAPILDNFCMGADTVSEIVLLSLHLLEWFLGQAVAGGYLGLGIVEILSQMASLPRIRQELDEMPESARCRVASWIDDTLRKLDGYQFSQGKPVPPSPERTFSDDDFTLYSTDKPLPEMGDEAAGADEQERLTGTALAALLAFDFAQ
jgi:hypothetical protein